MEIHDCAFIRSNAERGGAIGVSSMYAYPGMQVYRSSFEQCSAQIEGAVLLSGINQLVECHFVYVYQAFDQWSAKPSFSSCSLLLLTRFRYRCRCCHRANSALTLGGAILDSSSFNTSFYQNCTFQDNRANTGGAMALIYSSRPTFVFI